MISEVRSAVGEFAEVPDVVYGELEVWVFKFRRKYFRFFEIPEKVSPTAPESPRLSRENLKAKLPHPSDQNRISKSMADNNKRKRLSNLAAK